MLFEDLVLKHKGKVIAVLGGGEINEKDLKAVKPNIIISANGHGSDIADIDYVVAMDDVHTEHQYNMRDHIKKLTDAPILGPFTHNDVLLVDWPMAPRRVYTGTIAVWVAWVMGAKAIVLLGFDGYADEDDDPRPGYMDKVQEVMRHVTVPVRTVNGGPLSEVWPEFDKDEKWGRYKPHGSLVDYNKPDGMVMVRALKDSKLDDGLLAKGDSRKVNKGSRTVDRMLKHKMIEVVYDEE